MPSPSYAFRPASRVPSPVRPASANAAPPPSSPPAAGQSKGCPAAKFTGDAKVLFDPAVISRFSKIVRASKPAGSGDPYRLMVVVVPDGKRVVLRLLDEAGRPFASLRVEAVDQVVPGSLAMTREEFLGLPTDNGVVAISRSDGKYSVASDNKKFNLLGVDPVTASKACAAWKNSGVDDYNPGAFCRLGSVRPDHLKAALLTVSDESSRYAISGVLVRPGPDSLSLVSTDGRRLSVFKIPTLTREMNPSPAAIIDRVPAALAARFMPGVFKVDAMCIVKGTPTMFRCLDGDLTVYGKVVEGSFPPYESVIPSDSETSCTCALSVDRAKDFRAAAKNTSEDAQFCLFSFSAASKDSVVLKTRPLSGEWQSSINLAAPFEILPNVSEIKDTFEISFNPAFIADVLDQADAIGAGRVVARMTKKTRAAVFLSDGTDASLVSVVMPGNWDHS